MIEPDDQKHAKRLIRWGFIGSIIIFVLWAGSGVLLYCLPDRGTFGDMFGAINALFSGLAFLGVIVTIMLQYEELKEQRAEIRQARIAHQESADALSEQLRTANIRSKVESLNLLIESQVRILERLERGDTVSTAQRRKQLKTKIEKFENELEKVLAEEINRHQSRTT